MASTPAYTRGSLLSLSPSPPHFIRARARVYIWVKYKRKQSLVKHNTPENFSLATDVTVGARFPAAIYVHRIRRYWHSLLGISELASPRLIFRSHRRGNPKWAQPASGHLQALQIRNCPSGSGYRVPRSSPPTLREYLRSNTAFSPVPGILSCILSFPTRDLPESLQFGLPLVILVGYSRYRAYSRYRGLLSLPLANSHQRDPWYRSRGMCRYPRFFPSFSRILWSIRNLANLRILRQTRRVDLSRGVNFVPVPRTYTWFLVTITSYANCLLPHEIHLSRLSRDEEASNWLFEPLGFAQFFFFDLLDN